MTASAQLRTIQSMTNPLPRLWEVLALLELKQKVINERRYSQTDLELERELRRCEIERCLPILEELDEYT